MVNTWIRTMFRGQGTMILYMSQNSLSFVPQTFRQLWQREKISFMKKVKFHFCHITYKFGDNFECSQNFGLKKSTKISFPIRG